MLLDRGHHQDPWLTKVHALQLSEIILLQLSSTRIINFSEKLIQQQEDIIEYIVPLGLEWADPAGSPTPFTVSLQPIDSSH